MTPDERAADAAEERIRSALEERPDVLFAYLFGSRAGGRAHARSDLDVAVYLDPAAGGEDAGRRSWTGGPWAEIHADLVRAASADDAPRDRGGAPEGVDLVLLNDAPPLLSDRVARTGELLLSRDEPARIRWLVRTKSRYCDLRPLRERLDRTVSERLRSGEFGRRSPDGERA